jgi:peptidoglycan/xylan/chitin deacetylase (PgdA/CDA1 family)
MLGHVQRLTFRLLFPVRRTWRVVLAGAGAAVSAVLRRAVVAVVMTGFVAGHVLIPSAQAGGPTGNVLYHDRVVIIEFHDVSPTDRSAWTMTPAHFGKTIEQLQQAGFTFISPAQMTAFLEHKAKVPPDALLLTFDDGLADVYRYALPILRRDHIPFLFTIIGDRIGRTSTCLTPAEIRAMAADGLGTIGAHSWALHGSVKMMGRTIPRALAATAGESSGSRLLRLVRDGQAMQKEIRSLVGAPSPYYAWPFGAYDAVSIRAMRMSGFRFFFTSSPGPVTDRTDPARIPRIDVGEDRLTVGQIVTAIVDAACSSSRPPAQSGASLSAGQQKYLKEVRLHVQDRVLYP